MTAWLNYEYASWTADPDEVAATRKRGRKPPPFPLIPPVASRPRSLHERFSEAHAVVAAEYAVSAPAPRMVTDEEFDAALDQWM